MKLTRGHLNYFTHRFSSHSLSVLSVFSASLLLIGSVLWSDPVYAGKLDDFEESAKEQKKHKKPHHSHKEDDESFFDILFEGLFEGIIEGIGQIMMEGMIDGLFSGLEHLADSPGVPAKWSTQLQGSHHSFDDDISGKKMELFTQRNNLGFHWQKLWMEEEPINDTLTLSNWHLMIQTDNRPNEFGYASPLSLGLGVGGATLDGNDSDTGMSAILAIQYALAPTSRFKFTQTINWLEPGARMSDSNLALEFHVENIVLGAGYHWLKAQNEIIHGPMITIGVTF